MAKSKWIFREVSNRKGHGPSWLKPTKDRGPIHYTMRYDDPGLDESEVYVFRNGHFSLPRGCAPDNPKLEHVALAGTPEELTGHYIDFLIEDSPERFQTVRSLLDEVLRGNNPRKSQKRKTAKTLLIEQV